MASVKVHSGVFGHSTGKISKSRRRTVVKPILKKLHSHSDRESSLDLDRGWDDQPSPGFAAGPDFGTYDSDGSYHYSAPAFANTRSGRDVSFSLSATDIAGVGGHGAGALAAGREGARSKYSHVRSTSGNSHTSSIATTTSGRNGSTFVHPFQQTPYTSTPPLSYANSRASFENGITTGYSSTITEDDDDIDPYPSLHSTSTTPRPALYQSAYFQHPNHRRPSLASQRTSSISDGNQTARISATRSSSAQARPLGTASVNQSKSELNPSTVSSVAADSPLSSTAPLGTAAIILSSVQTNLTSSPASPMSPLRNSLDMGGFRMRSRSEVDMSTHQEQVREARRKFEAKERAKEEKYAREQHRKQERAENREAHRMEKTHSRLRKGSGGNGSVSSSTMSSGTDIRITTSRKQDAVFDRAAQEKIDFSTHGYNSTHDDGQSAPTTRADKVHFTSPLKRTKTAKRKTAGVWTAFVLWFRTRLLKLGRR